MHNPHGFRPREIHKSGIILPDPDFKITKTTYESESRVMGRGWFLHDQISMIIKAPEKYSYRWWQSKLRYYFNKLTFQRFAAKEEKC